MKMLKKIRFNVFAVLFAAFMLAVSWIAGANVITASADDAPPSEITYIDTNVETIEFVKHDTCVFFGFRLTESDYDDFGEFEGDFGGQPAYSTYEKYIALWLTYWKNFPQYNSEGAKLDQLYAYWNGSSVGPWFDNTVAQRADLSRLEFGFIISIPKGTTFPSATYVHGNCEGTPIMYKTTEDRAFYYDGTEFKSLAFDVATERIEATAELNSVNKKVYYEQERAQVEALIEAAKADIKACVSMFAVQDRMATFRADLEKIMTIADYAELAEYKTAKKAELQQFVDGLDKTLYDAEALGQITALQAEGVTAIETVMTFAGVDNAFAGVKFAINNVATNAEKADFDAYRSAAAAKIGEGFNAGLYREAEATEGLALVQNGKEAVGKATTYAEVDALSAEYISKISALKTKAQWEAEEKAALDKESENEDSSVSNGDNVVIIPGAPAEEEGGCGSVIGGIGITLGVTMMAASVIIKNKAGKKDEE